MLRFLKHFQNWTFWINYFVVWQVQWRCLISTSFAWVFDLEIFFYCILKEKIQGTNVFPLNMNFEIGTNEEVNKMGILNI